MEKNGDSQQDDYGRSRVHKSSEVHKRRLDKETRRTMRQRERDTARDQVQKASQAEAERQERFRVIHGGRDADHDARSRMRRSLAAQVPSPADVADPGVVPERVGGSAGDKPPITVISVGGQPAPASPEARRVAAQAAAADTPKASEQRGVDPEAQNAESPAQSAAEGAGEKANPRNRAMHARPQGTASQPAETAAGGKGGPSSADAADASDSDGSSPKKPHRARRRILIAIAIILGVLVILLGLFSWNRWLRYDDAAEIQGEWFAASAGRRAPIMIDGDVVIFNEETKWHYTLDTTAKTISFTFGSQEGGGRYWFARDNQHLIIEDGVGFTAFDTFLADLQRTVTGKADEIPSGETITVLSRSEKAADEAVAETAETSGAVALPDGSAPIGPSSDEVIGDEGSDESGASEDADDLEAQDGEGETEGDVEAEGDEGVDEYEGESYEEEPSEEEPSEYEA